MNNPKIKKNNFEIYTVFTNYSIHTFLYLTSNFYYACIKVHKKYQKNCIHNNVNVINNNGLYQTLSNQQLQRVQWLSLLTLIPVDGVQFPEKAAVFS